MLLVREQIFDTLKTHPQCLYLLRGSESESGEKRNVMSDTENPEYDGQFDKSGEVRKTKRNKNTACCKKIADRRAGGVSDIRFPNTRLGLCRGKNRKEITQK